MDTWEYFLHRLFHANQYLYRHFHSVHHRLSVPYAFGALYNHWFEGLLLDSLGAVVAQYLSFMTPRQAVLLFTFSTLKTVDDHSGYALPFDPFQIFFPNNASYHDIHHRVCFFFFSSYNVLTVLLCFVFRLGVSNTISANPISSIGIQY